MGIDVYFRRDVANVLRATACASEGAAKMAHVNDAELQAYQRGVLNTLVSVGLAFGLELVRYAAKDGAAPPLAGLLWMEGEND